MAKRHKAEVTLGDTDRAAWFSWQCTCGSTGRHYAKTKDATTAKNKHLAANR